MPTDTARTATVRNPFDAHLHVRQGEILKTVAPITALQMGTAIVMPNTKPPLTTYDQVVDYLVQLDEVAPNCAWIGTLYLTRDLDIHVVEDLWSENYIAGVKYYPPHGTTNAQDGVPPKLLYEEDSEIANVLRFMEEAGVPLLIHGEVVKTRTGEETDPYDREKLFIDEVMLRIRETYPRLKLSLEHISSERAVDFMRKHGDPDFLVCTVTAHHPLVDRRDQFRGGSNPHLHCLPMVKTERDRLALLQFLAEGHPFTLMGTDSAPHPLENKHGPLAFGGMFTAPMALQLYAEIFEQFGGALDERFQAFVSDNAWRFHGPAIAHHPNQQDVTVELSKPDPGTFEPFYVGEQELWPFGYHPDKMKSRIFQWHAFARRTRVSTVA